MPALKYWDPSTSSWQYVAAPPGPQGPQGTPGVQGPQGLQGTDVYSGTQGSQSPLFIPQPLARVPDTGPEPHHTIWIDPSDDVPPAPAGPQGPQGAAGPQGPQGDPVGVNPLIGTMAATTVLSAQVVGDAFRRYEMRANGTMYMGGGATSPVQAIYIAGSSVAIGNSASTPNATSTAVGSSAVASTGQAVAVGTSASAVGDSTAAGYNARATGQYGSAVGFQAVAGISGVALGDRTSATGTNGTAIGARASATGTGSIAIGRDSAGTGASATVQDQAVIGTALTQTKVAGLSTAFATKNSDYQMVRSDGTILGIFTMTVRLPSPVSAGAGATYRVINGGSTISYLVTVVPFGTETINGASSYLLETREGGTFTTDGANWYVAGFRTPWGGKTARSGDLNVTANNPLRMNGRQLTLAGLYLIFASIVKTGAGTLDAWLQLGLGAPDPSLAIVSGTTAADPGMITLIDFTTTLTNFEQVGLCVRGSATMLLRWQSQGGASAPNASQIGAVRIG